MSEKAIILTLLLLAIIVIISLWTPLTHPAIAQRWFSLPEIIWFAPVPLLVLVCCWGIVRSAYNRKASYGPFMLTLGLIFLDSAGWASASGPISFRRQSLSGRPRHRRKARALCWWGLLIIPVILMYTCWSYYVFRGKINPDEGYH